MKFPAAHSCRWKIAWNVSLCCSVLWKSCWWFFLEPSIAPYKVFTSLLILTDAVCLIECCCCKSTRLSKHAYDFFISWYSLYIWPLQSNFHFTDARRSWSCVCVCDLSGPWESIVVFQLHLTHTHVIAEAGDLLTRHPHPHTLREWAFPAHPLTGWFNAWW